MVRIAAPRTTREAMAEAILQVELAQVKVQAANLALTKAMKKVRDISKATDFPNTL